MKYKFIFLFLITISLSCVDEKNKIIIVDDENFIADEENEKLKLAVQEAQDNLNYFIDELKTHSNDTNYWFSAKTKFESLESVDHVWFKTLEFKPNDSFIGILLNEPNWSNSLKIGDTINIHRKNIEDWYIENESENKVEGDYTEKILFREEK